MGRLDRIAGQCEVRFLTAPWAGGLTLAFARWCGPRPILAPLGTGTGPTPDAALRRALGEIAENLALIPDAGRVEVHDSHGRRLAEDARARPDAGAANLGSEGCAAGETDAEAQLAAFCERAERTALALWWQGGLEAQRVPLPDRARVYRAGSARRRDLLFMLPFLPGLTVCLAVSDDGAGGQLVFGSAAALWFKDAAEAALREAMQAEIAWLAPPHHPDVPGRDHVHRGLSQRLPALLAAPVATVAPEDVGLDDLLALLRARGLSFGFADLTLPDLGVPVWRFVCPDWPRARPLFNCAATPGRNDAGLTRLATG